MIITVMPVVYLRLIKFKYRYIFIYLPIGMRFGNVTVIPVADVALS